MKQQHKHQHKIVQSILQWVRHTTKTAHGWIVLCGLLVGLCYFPFWVSVLAQRALKGAVSWFLIVAMLTLAFAELWNARKRLEKFVASEEDRFLGHILILCGVALFPFCLFAVWSQAIVWLIVLIGIACSTWGLGFFRAFMLPTLFISLSVYPRLGNISRIVWDSFVPANALEKFMAWSGSVALNGIGRAATPDGVFIVLPEGAVEVGWGCNGLDMAITMSIAGLFMGLIYKQSRKKIFWMMLAAALIAMAANIPRIMLVTIAHVYWGKEWFQFWHGFWGGQIFVSVLFTIYYYVVMALIKKRHMKLGA